jgi:release factor glutamine methyltransferase
VTEAEARRILTEAGVDDPAGDVRRLLSHAGDDELRFAEMIARRAAREPVSHIIGTRAFYAHDFIVTSDVLDPRPDTETLVEAALEHPFATVLDLGTGSGCILLSLLAARPDATGLGVDISEKALAVAQRNAEAIGVDARTTLAQSDWFENVAGGFDLIVSNPPYISEAHFAKLALEVQNFEPKAALTPGGDGLDPYRIIATEAPRCMTPHARLMVEIGYDQGAAVQRIFAQAGLANIRVRHDINGKDRVVMASLR